MVSKIPCFLNRLEAGKRQERILTDIQAEGFELVRFLGLTWINGEVVNSWRFSISATSPPKGAAEFRIRIDLKAERGR